MELETQQLRVRIDPTESLIAAVFSLIGNRSSAGLGSVRMHALIGEASTDFELHILRGNNRGVYSVFFESIKNTVCAVSKQETL